MKITFDFLCSSTSFEKPRWATFGSLDDEDEEEYLLLLLTDCCRMPLLLLLLLLLLYDESFNIPCLLPPLVLRSAFG